MIERKQALMRGDAEGEINHVRGVAKECMYRGVSVLNTRIPVPKSFSDSKSFVRATPGFHTVLQSTLLRKQNIV